MTATYVELSYWQVGLAAALILLCGAISVAMQLGLERSLLIAAVRTTAQLILIGLVLEWVFRLDRWYVVVAVMAVMTAVAGLTAAQRCKRSYQGLWLSSLVSVWASTWLITAYAIFAVIQRTDTWYQPQYVIPLLGMMLGNALTGISLGLGALLESLATRRDHVETQLALGATRWEAAREPVQHAVRTGLTPIINTMMVVGIVSLPGMMTGQLLSGTAPGQAVRYQIVIMFLIATSTILGLVAVVLLTYFRLFSGDHQFLAHRLKQRK